MAFRPSVIPLPTTNAPPKIGIMNFQAMTITIGTSTTISDARRLRHWVVRSAFSSDKNTAPVVGNVREAGWAMVSAGETGEVVDMANNLFGCIWVRLAINF